MKIARHGETNIIFLKDAPLWSHAPSEYHWYTGSKGGNIKDNCQHSTHQIV